MSATNPDRMDLQLELSRGTIVILGLGISNCELRFTSLWILSLKKNSIVH